MGRNRDQFWQYVDSENKCIYCGAKMHGAFRIKYHLAQEPGGGISRCSGGVPDDVKAEALSAIMNNSNKRIKESATSNDLNEANVNSNLASGSARGLDSGQTKKPTRKRDEFWQYVDTSNGNKCQYCGHRVRSAFRIKCHLAQSPEMGIRICDKVPNDVKRAAASALNSSNKRVKPSRATTNLEENDTDSCFSRVSARGEVEVDLLPIADLVGKEFQTYLNRIWGWLMGDEVSLMGVWGMGGVGKTALLKHIHNKLIDHNHNVIWITVSQNYDIRQLQKDIAMSIDKNIWDEDEDGELKIAARFLRAFKKMDKCVVILDDVWYDIPLEDVGIPSTSRGIRTIVASRLLDVCKSIGCKENIVNVKCLSHDEDFALFSKSHEDVVTLSDDIKNIARDLSKECEGLPLAIVKIVRSMKGKADIREWRDALSKLSSTEMDHNDIKRYVFPVLKSSFDHLNDRTVQDCFLCLPLYTEDEFLRDDLKRLFANEALIDDRQYFQTQLDEGHSILNKLVNNSLFLQSGFFADQFYLHRLVEAMAVNIGKESYGCIYKTELPDEQEWKEDLLKIFLTGVEIAEIPFGMSPKCPKLSILLMCGNYHLEVIPDNFFINMLSLKRLDLSMSERIEVLPASISNLECLTVLLLSWCRSLHSIPSLAKLRQLRKLDLTYTDITQIPPGFENLTNLRWLHLEGTAVIMKAQHLERLPMLVSIGAKFDDEGEFNACVRICLGRDEEDVLSDVFYDIDSRKTIRIVDVEDSNLLLPSEIDELMIRECDESKSLCDVLSIQQTSNKLHISKLDVWRCSELECLFCSSDDCTLCSSLQGLNVLEPFYIDSLSMLCKENEVASSFLPFSHLTKLSICGCNGMKKLLAPGMSTQLHNLEEIEVEDCGSMEEIFSTEKSCIGDEWLWPLLEADEVEMDDTNAEAINLPNLKSAFLWCLPQLKSACKGIIVCGSLEEFDILDCPQLKRVPQIQPHFEIQV